MNSMTVDCIATSTGGKKITETIDSSQAMLGVETGETVRHGFDYEFADYPFTKEEVTFEDHLRVVEMLQPEIAVAPDIEDKWTLEDVLEKADELKKYADQVVIVPKEVHPEEVPREFRVGYPNQPGFGTNGKYEIHDFKKVHAVHVLGGSPMQAHEVVEYINNVVSYDSASVIKAGMAGGKVWNGGWEDASSYNFEDLYEWIRFSLNNVVRDFKTLNSSQRAMTEVTARHL